jgi:hypothetical protein
MTLQGSVEWQAWMLRAWHLAILRFAVTLDNADRLNVLAIANEIDKLGRQQDDKSNFSFFRKSSSQLFTAMVQPSHIADVTLHQYLAQIDDARLKRALAGALTIEPPEPFAAKRRSRRDADLWRGLS